MHGMPQATTMANWMAMTIQAALKQFKNKRECYSGGSVYADTPLPGGDSRTLIEILGTNDIKKHCITALLNASLSENVDGFTYILTVDQVIGLCNGTIPVPGGQSLRGFLDSTWI